MKMFNAIPSLPLANEFSLYCGKERIDSFEVTRCASTKWNFASIYPGLVGGHCIGIDPYYLIERAKSKSLDLPRWCQQQDASMRMRLLS